MNSDNKLIRVSDVMKRKFDIIDGRMTVREALSTMKHDETKLLIVDKRYDADEYGMVLISDIAKEVLAKDRSPDRVNIYEIMVKPLLPVDPDMDVRYCARFFERFSLSRAPVVKNKEVVGIISYTDMVWKGLVKF
ncbi:MAG: CBS domain-containing protein [Gammaproteobacteria bacterium]|nr:CBS domain-containing protein [Gammaproteobacteria bacterium]